MQRVWGQGTDRVEKTTSLEEEVRFALTSIARGFRNGTFYGTKVRVLEETLCARWTNGRG